MGGELDGGVGAAVTAGGRASGTEGAGWQPASHGTSAKVDTRRFMQTETVGVRPLFNRQASDRRRAAPHRRLALR